MKYALAEGTAGRGGGLPMNPKREETHKKKKQAEIEVKEKRNMPAEGCASVEMTFISFLISCTRYSEPSAAFWLTSLYISESLSLA